MGRGPNTAETWARRTQDKMDNLAYYAMKIQEERMRREAFDRFLRPLLLELQTLEDFS